MKVTEEQLRSLEQWAAIDLREREGREVQDIVDEVRAMRIVVSAALYFEETDACGMSDEAQDGYTKLVRAVRVYRGWCEACGIYCTCGTKP